MRSMGEVIRALRLEHHLSQEQFAKLFNVAPSAVGMWENNKRVPGKETLESIADYFNVDMNFLYGKTLIRNSYRELRNTIDPQWGDDTANREYLADKSDLLEIYNDLVKSDELTILFDKTKDLEPKDIESVLVFVQMLRKQRGMDD